MKDLSRNLPKKLYEELYSLDNLELAFKKARKGKTLKHYVIEFESEIENNLLKLQQELISQTYKPMPLQTFILRDPKTRKISKSSFRDRVIHHAICNIIEPRFEKSFIDDSYANRIGKGTLNAIKRFEQFAKTVSKNYSKKCYVLKADIKHYFETVDHATLLSILKRKIPDQKLLDLIEIILSNYQIKEKGKGMPLGNLTSQFFANVYLNELDQFVKHKLKAKYYLRYVDDFVILDQSYDYLKYCKNELNQFITKKLFLELHPDKSKILNLSDGISFLGMRIFPYHKRIKKKNIRRFDNRLKRLKDKYQNDRILREQVIEHFGGWLAYISNANTYKYRKHLVRGFNISFPIEKNILVSNIKKHENFVNKTNDTSIQFSVQKTLELFNKGTSIEKIAKSRNLKINTIWNHLANLIEYNQISVWKLLSAEKIKKILSSINTENDKLKEIMLRLNDNISYEEINCVLAYVKSKNRDKNIFYHINWYKKVHCLRKCYFIKKQREICSNKFNQLIKHNPNLTMKRKAFLDLNNNHLNICILPEKEKREYISWSKFKIIKSHVKKQNKV